MLRHVFSRNILVRVSNKAPVGIRANLFAQYSTKLNTNDFPVSHSEEIKPNGKKVFFCRCWQSKKFPYCDASHKAYNEKTGDKLGPVAVSAAPITAQPEQK